MEAKAILYHSNKEDECKKFISKKDYLILSKNSKDDIWLGKGMYFWDNRGNANWWNQKQSRRKPNEVYSIAVVNADLCELLDLTDFDIYMKLEELLTLLKTKKLRLIAHTHPDFDSIKPSADDRDFLKYIEQSKSIIISYITGYTMEFTNNIFDDYTKGSD